MVATVVVVRVAVAEMVAEGTAAREATTAAATFGDEAIETDGTDALVSTVVGVTVVFVTDDSETVGTEDEVSTVEATTVADAEMTGAGTAADVGTTEAECVEFDVATTVTEGAE